MGLSQIYNDFYEQIKPFNALPSNMVTGQIAWVPAYFIEQIPYIFDFERERSTDHFAVKFNVRQLALDDFKHKAKLPVKGLPLSPTEECLAVRAKKRPCVMITKNLNLTVPAQIGSTMTQAAKRNMLHDVALFLPLYGVQDANHAGGFPQVMVDRIKVFMYEQFFFFNKGIIPNSTRDFLIDDAIGRFDRMFVSTLTSPAVYATDGKLIDPVLNVLIASMARYLKIPVEASQAENFSNLLEIIKETLPNP